MEGNAPQNPDLSVKTFATPATTWASHVENYQQSTLKFTLPSEGSAFCSPADRVNCIKETFGLFFSFDPVL